MKILVTGGSGFIGSNLIEKIIFKTLHHVVNVDLLTYAANTKALLSLKDNPRYSFYQANICDDKAIKQILELEQPDTVMHLAAESHVDRSIGKPSDFIQTNIYGTFVLLNEVRSYLNKIKNQACGFRFIHISTDEVYGSLSESESAFTEDSKYKPNSPYSASKASSDLLVRAWQKTYNMPAITTHCSNNYGPYQNTEKFIPKIITNVLKNENIPIYGKGNNVRDWVHVSDHCDALLEVMYSGKIGHTYCIGGNQEKRNIDVVDKVITTINELIPTDSDRTLLKTFVSDRLAHDLRYAINNDKITADLGWKPKIMFDEGIFQTVEWYLKNPDWWQQLGD